MQKIYKGQSALRLIVKTYTDLTGINAVLIRYKKPDGNKGNLKALIFDEKEGIIYHDFKKRELDAAGWWRFWAFVTFGDGRTAAGDAVKIFVWNEGEA
jgi:hypothetical protein